MIIGHFHKTIWAKGGIATYIRRVSTAQKETGHQIYYFTQFECSGSNADEAPIVISTESELFIQAEKLNLDVLHLHQSIETLPPRHLPVIRTLHGHSPYCPSGSRYLARWSKPCDRAYSPIGCLWGHIVDHCGSVRLPNLVGNFQQTWQEKTVLSQIPVIAVSHFLKEQMLRVGYDTKLIHVLHHFAPDILNDEPPPSSEIPHFVFLGRISPQKGIAWLLQALKHVNHPVHLDIAGEGYQEPEMKNLVEKLGLSDRVTFHGWVSSEQADHLIRSARALICPSLWHEPAGLVILEAMANSRAVIASRVGGIPEIVLPEINGLLVNPGHQDEMTSSIEHLAADWTFAAQLGQAGYQLVSNQLNLKNHLEQLTSLYKQVISSI